MVKRLLLGSTQNTYLPTILPARVPDTLDALGHASKVAFALAHRPGDAGNFQQLHVGHDARGVSAFDTRFIMDYDDTTADCQASFYDRLLGAVSGLQLRIPVKTDIGEDAAGLLVLCSPIRAFFHHLLHTDEAEARRESTILICDDTWTTSSIQQTPVRRWDSERYVAVRYAPQNAPPASAMLAHLRAAVDKVALPDHISRLSEGTIEDDQIRLHVLELQEPALTAQPIVPAAGGRDRRRHR